MMTMPRSTDPPPNQSQCLAGPPGIATLSCIVITILVTALQADAQTRRFEQSFSVHLNYTAGSRLFLFPFSTDAADRSITKELGSFPSVSVSYAHGIGENLRVQLTGEYIVHTDETRDSYQTAFIDGFRFFSLEADGEFILPFSGRTVLVYVGGGGGVYVAERIHSIAGVSARSRSSSPSFGILTFLGVDVLLTSDIAVSVELRFRDPLITVENAFDQPGVQSNGIVYPLDTNPATTRLNLNGNVYTLGLSYLF